MSLGPPEGTRYLLPDAAARRTAMMATLRELYRSWGYDLVESPSLERYDAHHPRAEQSFKLVDRDGGVLALRSDFTPALAALVRGQHPEVANGEQRPLRWQYAGTVWQATQPEIVRVREFSQVGLELIGVSNARADAEIIHLARESLRVLGLRPRLEVGNPGFVRALFEEAKVPKARQDDFADAIDRKDRSDLRALIEAEGLQAEPGSAVSALLQVPDLFGGDEVLVRARQSMPWPRVQHEIGRLEGVLREFEDASELMLDLAMARRLSYYTGVTFRAYTPDFGQPLLGGGRYDGALLPAAAGFSIGMERLLQATRALSPEPEPPAKVLSLDDPAARRLRRGGVRVLRALQEDPDEARREALTHGAAYLLLEGRLEAAGDGASAEELAQLQALIDDGAPSPEGAAS